MGCAARPTTAELMGLPLSVDMPQSIYPIIRTMQPPSRGHDSGPPCSRLRFGSKDFLRGGAGYFCRQESTAFSKAWKAASIMESRETAFAWTCVALRLAYRLAIAQIQRSHFESYARSCRSKNFFTISPNLYEIQVRQNSPGKESSSSSSCALQLHGAPRSCRWVT